MAYTREEIEAAMATYRRAREAASATGDWSKWANVFTEDAHYIEHAYGEFHGREAIREWITGVMAPFPNMTFPEDWCVIDAAEGTVVFQCQNEFPAPFGPNGKPFGFPTWTRLVYGGGGLWKSEEDIYNPTRDAPREIKGWLAAGGKFKEGERVKMQHR